MTGFDIIGPGAYGPPQRPIAPLRPEVGPGTGQGIIGGGSIGEGLLGDGIQGLDNAEQGEGFSAKLAEALKGVSTLEGETKAKAEALARGENVELHDLMISMGKSDVAFNMMLEVRNKLLEAWETITRSAV